MIKHIKHNSESNFWQLPPLSKYHNNVCVLITEFNAYILCTIQYSYLYSVAYFKLMKCTKLSKTVLRIMTGIIEALLSTQGLMLRSTHG